MIRRIALLAAIAVVAMACQGSADAGSEGLLAVVDDGGDLVVLAPDGEPVRTMTELDDGVVVFQPIWSGPDHLVYVEQGALGGELVVVGIDGAERQRVEFAAPPFYVYPRPGDGDAADIVSLRNDLEGGLAAEVIDADGNVSGLDGDFPFFFTWTADGRVVAHLEGVFLEEVFPGRRPVADGIGAFGAPGSRGNDVVFIRTAGGRSILSVLADGEVDDVATVRGPAQLVVGGDRVAVRSVATDEGGAVEALAQTIPSLPSDTLVVVGLDDGAVDIVATGGVVAFFWDPSGDRLLYLVVEDESRGQLRWHVWEEGTVSDYAIFVPDASWFANFVPFFDQYSQSMTLWSPDGDAFAFPGSVDGEAGVWVQHLEETSATRVSSGSWVAWGPSR